MRFLPRRRTAGSTRLLLGAAVLVGLVVAHDLVFRLVAPEPQAHAHLMAETGHGGWTPGRIVATILVVLIIVLVAPPARRVSAGQLVAAFGRVVARLAAVQTAGFLALETGERLAGGATLAELADDPILGLGILVQLGVGLIGALLLVAMLWLVICGAPRLRRSYWQPGRAIGAPQAGPARPTHLLRSGVGPRAPPRVV